TAGAAARRLRWASAPGDRTPRTRLAARATTSGFWIGIERVRRWKGGRVLARGRRAAFTAAGGAPAGRPARPETEKARHGPGLFLVAWSARITRSRPVARRRAPWHRRACTRTRRRRPAGSKAHRWRGTRPGRVRR